MKQTFALWPAPSAQTADSIALIWEKQPDAACYQVFFNGKQVGMPTCTDYTAEELSPDTEYRCQVLAVARDGTVLAGSNLATARTKAQAQVVNITAFGAVGDGLTLNTRAIQAAIDACPANGMVYVPEGTFLTGALFLKSHMTLHIQALGRLQGTDNPADYPLMEYLWEGREHICYAGLLNTRHEQEERLCNITISGGGVIDGNGMRLFHAERNEQAGQRGRVICLRNVDGLYLKDITVRNSPSWCVHLILCQQISVNQVKVHTRCDEYGKKYQDVFNGDGIDPEYCQDVAIFHSLIASQDDCIAVKAGRDEEGRAMGIASERIRITNCTFQSGFGVAMGSEMAGGIRDVLVQDCVFQGAYSIASVKSPRGRGGVIENVTYDSCTLTNYNPEHSDTKWFRGAILVDQFYSHEAFDPDAKEPVTKATSTIRNITFRHIVIDTDRGNAIFLAGLPESPLENISFQNVVALGKTGMKAFNVNGLTLENFSVAARQGEDSSFHNVRRKE